MEVQEQPVLSMKLISENLLIRDVADEDAIISRTVTEYENDRVKSLGTSAFQSASQLAYASFPEVTDTAGYVFNYCSSLVEVHLPKLGKLGNGLFAGCTKLETITLPAAKQIYSSAFSGCTKLAELILPGNTVPILSANVFANTPILAGTGYIYVKDDLVDQYKVATNWSVVAGQIRPVSELEGQYGTN